MLIFLFILTIVLLVALTIWVSIMYDVYVPDEPTTQMERRCIDIKERLKWLNWKLQEQRLKGENSS